MKAPIGKTVWGVILLLIVTGLMMIGQYTVQQIYSINAADVLVDDSAYYITHTRETVETLVSIFTVIVMVLVGFFMIVKPWVKYYKEEEK